MLLIFFSLKKTNLYHSITQYKVFIFSWMFWSVKKNRIKKMTPSNTKSFYYLCTSSNNKFIASQNQYFSLFLRCYCDYSKIATVFKYFNYDVIASIEKFTEMPAAFPAFIIGSLNPFQSKDTFELIKNLKIKFN